MSKNYSALALANELPVAQISSLLMHLKGKTITSHLAHGSMRDDWFTGVIDDFAYFKDALSEAKIKELYDAMISPSSDVKAQEKLPTVWGAIKE